MTEQERIAHGALIFRIKQKNNPFKQTAKIAKIIRSEWFVSGHDDTAIAVSLCDKNANVLWKTRFSDDDEKNVGALLAYLKSEFQCPVEDVWLGE